MSYHLIVAIDHNNGIGKDGTIPWYIKEDLKHFSTLTKGMGNNAIIMGRNTWNSLKSKKLPNRLNIVLSKTMTFNNILNLENPDYIFKSIEDLLNYQKNLNIEKYWIIGGQDIYESFLKLNICSTAYITVIDKKYNCDRFFPLDLCNKNMKLESVKNLGKEAKIYKYVKND